MNTYLEGNLYTGNIESFTLPDLTWGSSTRVANLYISRVNPSRYKYLEWRWSIITNDFII